PVDTNMGAVDVQVRAGEVRLHQRNDLFQAVDPDTCTIERDPHRGVFVPDPAGAEAELQAAVRQQLDGRNLLRQHSWHVEVDAENAPTPPDRLRDGGGRSHGWDRGQSLGAVCRTRPEIVIAEVDRAVAELLGTSGDRRPLRGRRGVRGLQAEPERSHSHEVLLSPDETLIASWRA